MKNLKYLKHQHAMLRSQMINKGSMQYKSFMKLLRGESYQVAIQSSFSMNKLGSLFFDFKGKMVNEVVVNGKQVQQAIKQYGGYFIQIPQKYLSIGKNNCYFRATNDYSRDGNGIVSFSDLTGEQFIYTQSQSHFANWIYPVMDQPDIKGTMEYTMIHPKQWEILSNQQRIELVKFTQQKIIQNAGQHNQRIKRLLNNIGQNYMISRHKPTKLLPSYLFCFVAGPYKRLECKNPYKGMNMDLFCIESKMPQLIKYSQFIWDVTITCMKFYQKFFNCSYQFNKYQQIFVNQYKWGAMQNPGIVTYNDIYLFKQHPSPNKVVRFANVLAHQLSHHWFGNLVTMKWWDDLWLNESFADFISHYALQQIKNDLKSNLKYDTALLAFNNGKSWGYAQDQMKTTHPIRGQVQNTDVAQNIFDGITYAKGSAVMYQLLFLMGDQNFSKGLSLHFKKYPFDNATLIQFLESIDTQFKIKQFTLNQWKQMWLERAGMNWIKIVIPKEQNKLIIKQGSCLQQYNTLRYHKIKIALINNKGQISPVDCLIKPQQQTIIEIPKGDYVAYLPNYGDFGFMKILLDEKSIQWYKKNLKLIKCSLSRNLVWKALYDMVRDAQVSAKSFIDVFLSSIEQEEADQVFQRQFQIIKVTIDSYVPAIHRQPLKKQIYNKLKQMLIKVQVDQKIRRIVIQNNLPKFVQQKEDIQFLLKWFDGKQLVNKPMDNSQRWITIDRLYSSKSFSNQIKQQYYKKQSEIDKSITSRNKLLKYKVLLATDQQYDNYYKKLSNQHQFKSYNEYQNQALGFTDKFNSQRCTKYEQKYYQNLLRMVQSEGGFNDFAQNFTNLMLNRSNDDLIATTSKLQKLIVKGTYLICIKNIKQLIDIFHRRIKCYETFNKQ